MIHKMKPRTISPGDKLSYIPIKYTTENNTCETAIVSDIKTMNNKISYILMSNDHKLYTDQYLVRHAHTTTTEKSHQQWNRIASFQPGKHKSESKTGTYSLSDR